MSHRCLGSAPRDREARIFCKCSQVMRIVIQASSDEERPNSLQESYDFTGKTKHRLEGDSKEGSRSTRRKEGWNRRTRSTALYLRSLLERWPALQSISSYFGTATVGVTANKVA